MKERPALLILMNILVIAAVMFFFNIEVSTKNVLIGCFLNGALYIVEIFYLIKIKKTESNN